MKIRKAIIPAAGLGTRFLPATKAMPKEMLPILDKPTIQYIVEEAIESGIEDIIIVTGKGKRAIEDHFDNSIELENKLLKNGKFDLLTEVQRSASLVDIHYIRQKEPKGLGHAIWCARKFIGNEPFAVLLGDDIVRSEKPCLKQMLDVYEMKGLPLIGVQPVKIENVSRYGIIDPESNQDRIYTIKQIIEKPRQQEAPSNLAITGRYILVPEIFEILERLKPGLGDEIQLTDALNELNRFIKILAYQYEGNQHDVGDKFGFITTIIEYALEREEFKKPLLNYMKAKVEENQITTKVQF